MVAHRTHKGYTYSVYPEATGVLSYIIFTCRAADAFGRVFY